MLINNYNYALVDGSFLLTRNLWVATKDKTIEEMDPGDVVKLTIQTLNKLGSTWNIIASKILMIFDEWDKSLGGYYRSWLIRNFVSYKGSRVFMTKELLEKMKNDPNVSEEEIKKAERELAVNKVKFEAKKIMKEELWKIGIPYFSQPGWEFDDIATLSSFELHGKSQVPNVIITKDSDLNYSLCPSCCQFLLPTRGSDPKVITYDEVYYSMPQVLRDRGLSLYMYHAYIDSLGVAGHNDNLKTIKKGHDGTTTILNILNGDYSDVENLPAFLAQMESFDLTKFPDLDTVKNMIHNDFQTKGHISSAAEFREFCTKNNIKNITDSYYLGMAGRLDQKLYCE